MQNQLTNPAASPRALTTSPCNSPEATLERLKQPVPIDRQEAMQELSRALALCAPAGMGQDDRALWLAAAYAEVAEMQAEVFRQAITKVRKAVDHPAKIIPALWAEAQSWRAVGVNSVIDRRQCSARHVSAGG